MKKMNKITSLMKGGKAKSYTLMLLAFAMLQNSVFATGKDGLVWEEPTSMIQQSISGPMAKAISLVVIVVSAFGWAFTDGGSFLGKGIKIVCALAIIAGAVSKKIELHIPYNSIFSINFFNVFKSNIYRSYFVFF